MPNLKKRVLIWWSLWRHAVPTTCNAIASLVCYVIGINYSDAESAMPFARSGALATAFAIGFSIYDFRRSLEKSEETAAASFSKITSNLPLTGASSQQGVEGKLSEKTTLATRKIVWWNAIILMLATLIWGFGDLTAIWMQK